MLWEPCEGAVLTSATLAPLGSFAATRAALGLSGAQDRATEARLHSPFDYARSRLRIPKMSALPQDVEAHTTEVARQVRAIAAAADGGVLVLFASARQLREVRERINGALAGELFVQGELPVAEILSRHREAIGAGRRSVILGLASFAEGIDLPGRLCTRVVLAKLPFPAPEEPLVAAACEWIERSGGSGFAAVSLPRGATRFAQAVGRLVRSVSDWGEVVVLDRRLASSGYGARMLAPLPMRVLVA